MSQLTLVVAATTKDGIGQCGTLPWRVPQDLAYFGRVTTDAPAAQTNVLFMGRKTWESIPQKFRPLKKRINVVLSQNEDYPLFPHGKQTDSARLRSDLKRSVGDFGSQSNVHRLFVIGGSSLYQEALEQGPQQSNSPSLQADRILITRIYNPEFECDVFFPSVLDGTGWKRATRDEHSAWVGFEVPAGIQTENGVEFEFQMWVRTGRVLETVHLA